jgi:hypothetical protein
METPATVRVEELGSDASSYRDAIDERRRVIHVRGASPRIVWWTAAAFLAPLVVAGCVVTVPLPPAYDSFVVLSALVLAVLLPVSAFVLPTLLGQLAWRSAQWARLELRAKSLHVSTGPLGTPLRVDDWSVRDPALVRRESKWGRIFEHWDLFGEREDGWRVHLASFFDEAGATWVMRQLQASYAGADERPRAGFAARLGPMPERVRCEGRAEDPESGWRARARCPGGALASAVLTLPLSVLLIGSSVLCVAALSVAPSRAPAAAAIALVGATILGVMAVLSALALRDALRSTLLRWRGEVIVELEAEHIRILASPLQWRLEFPSTERRVALRVTPIEHEPDEARVEVLHGATSQRIDAPLGLDEARYLAAIVEAFEDARLARRSSPHLRDSEYAEP